MSNSLPSILLVDDTPANLAVMRRLLAKVDCEIVEAEDGNEALARFLEREYALVLLDVHMPGMDGYEVAHLMRHDPDSPRTPIIFVTAAYDDDIHRDRGYESGAVDYLAKPIEPGILLAKVRVFLELYQAKREVEEMKNSLESVVEIRTAELRASLQVADRLRESAEESLHRAEQADQVRTRFLSRISHELRTPMNGILGLLQLLNRDELEEKQRTLVEGIESSANNLLVTLNEVLDFTQLSRGQIPSQASPFHLGVLLRDVSDSIQSQAAEKGLAFEEDFKVDTGQHFLGDSNLIRRTLQAFGHNAVKFSARGTVRLLAEGQPGDGRISLRLGVSDEGPGISAEQRESIFESFVQGDESSTRTTGGVGLGLPVARALAEAMGGQVILESEPGRGSTFWLSLDLPLAEAAAAPEAEAPREGQTLRVLVAEDNKVNQQVACGMLRKLDVEAEVANDGVEAVERFSGGGYHLVLMDLDMPRKDGFDATREIRALEAENPDRPQARIVALTANLEGETRQRCMEAGMDDYLGKPVRLEQLREVIRQFEPV